MFSNFWGSYPEEGWLDHVILELHTLSDSGLIGSAVLQFPPVPTRSHPFPYAAAAAAGPETRCEFQLAAANSRTNLCFPPFEW